MKMYEVISYDSRGSKHYKHGRFKTIEEAENEVERLIEEGGVWNCWFIEVYV